MDRLKGLPFAACVVLSACGGGGGDGSSAPVATGPATLNVAIAPLSQTASAAEDEGETTLSFTATQSGTTSDPVVADLQYDKTLLTLQGSVVNAGGQYVATFKTPKNLAGGLYKGVVNFRLCRETACTTVYPGSSQSFAYTVDVKLKDWTALQRNAGHTGYVHANIQAADIKKAWEWVPAYTTRVSGIATKSGTIFVSRANQDGTSSVHALASATGAEQWSYNLGTVYSFSAPSVGGSQLYVSTMVTSSGDNQNVVLDASTGKLVRTLPFAAQWSSFASPTPYGSDFYTASGYYGNVVYAYDAAAGVTRWTANGKGGNIWDGETPAVDEKYVYYYSGATLDVFDRGTGTLVRSIADPSFQWGGYTGKGGPVLGSRNNVLSYSGSYNGDNDQQPKPLVSYSLTKGAYAWRSADVYVTLPAVADGTVYVGRNTPMRLDALNEDTGAILWSWTPPAGETFQGNAIVTDKLVFVSTNAKVYAISITDTTHPIAWSADTPGELAISGDGMLIVAARSPTGSGGKLTAYSLR